MEYEEGDHLRVLPCHHEFHRICIDKWLKEIHRVSSLCRGNVCDASTVNQIRTTQRFDRWFFSFYTADQMQIRC
jgi:hypothetical protein